VIFAAGFAFFGATFGYGQVSFLVDARAQGPNLIVNEIPVLALTTSSSTSNPAERAKSAAAVLVTAKEGQIIEVEAPEKAKTARLMLGTRTVITVTEAEAKVHKSNPTAVAKAWASRLNNALLLDTIELDRKELGLPPDRGGEVAVLGSRARKAQVSVTDPSLVKIGRSLGKLTVKPLAIGTTTIRIANGPVVRSVTVKVMPYAAKFPMHLTAEVTGSPASVAVVESAIQTAVEARIPLPAGVTYRLGTISAAALPAGGKHVADLPIKAEGPNHFPVSGLVRVTVTNVPLGREQERELWYSNDPENILGPGQIYWGQLNPGGPVRFLFHHFNRASRPVVIQFVLSNPSDSPASVAVIMGDSEPSDNPTLAGYRAGDQFMQAWLARSGEVVQVPPKSVVPLVLRRIGPLDTASGLAHMTVLGKNSPTIDVVGDAILPEALEASWRSVGYPAWPWRRVPPMPTEQYRIGLKGSPRHVYPSPLRQERFEFQVGGNFSFIRVGQEAIPDVAQSKNLLGNFGVQYDIRGTIANPTEKATDVEVVFEASAGYSGALFVVNGRYMPANLLQAKQCVVLYSTNLKPGDVEPIAIQTVPLSGAHYPATIMVRPSGILWARTTFRDIVSELRS